MPGVGGTSEKFNDSANTKKHGNEAEPLFNGHACYECAISDWGGCLQNSVTDCMPLRGLTRFYHLELD